MHTYNPQWTTHSEGVRIVRGCEEWLCVHMAEYHCQSSRCGAKIGCVCTASCVIACVAAVEAGAG